VEKCARDRSVRYCDKLGATTVMSVDVTAWEVVIEKCCYANMKLSYGPSRRRKSRDTLTPLSPCSGL